MREKGNLFCNRNLFFATLKFNLINKLMCYKPRFGTKYFIKKRNITQNLIELYYIHLAAQMLYFIQPTYLEFKFILWIKGLCYIIHIDDIEQILENDVFIIVKDIKLKSMAQIMNILKQPIESIVLCSLWPFNESVLGLLSLQVIRLL